MALLIGDQKIIGVSKRIGIISIGGKPIIPDELLVHHDFFRPIHYLGSKLKILNFLKGVIDQVDTTGGRVCDLFAGSGSVSFKLAETRNVTAVDIQEYSRVICSALLNPVEFSGGERKFASECRQSPIRDVLEWAIEPLAKHEELCLGRASIGELEPLCDMLENGSIVAFELGRSSHCSPSLSKALASTLSRLKSSDLLSGSVSLVIRYFGGIFFSYSQSAHLDTLLDFASRQQGDLKNYFLSAILSTASDVVNTVGKQFAQPIMPRGSDGAPKMNLWKMVSKDRVLDVFTIFENWLNRYASIRRTGNDHHVHKMDYSDALDILADDVKVIYADPPYTRDHYSRFYHVLETLCLRDNPEISTITKNGKVMLSRGLYREQRHQSPFCIKSQAPDAFENLFLKARNTEATLLLSYSPYDISKKERPRLLTIEQLGQLARKFYRHVEFISPGHFSHNKLNSSDKNHKASNDAELLMVCRVH